MRIRCAGLSLSLIALASTAHAQRPVPAWTYAINITYDSGTGPANRGSIAMRYRTTANVLRTEMVQVAGTANQVTNGVDIEGFYTLLNDTDSTLTTVMPGQRSAMVMANPMSLLKEDGIPTVDANTTTQSFEDLGAGEMILGHPTHHYRTTTAGTMTIKIGDEVCTRSANADTDLWVAPDVDIVPAMRSVMSHYTAMFPDSAKMKSAGASSSRVRGLPLRTKTRTVAVMPTGESRVIETTMEYVELSNAPLDPSLFAVPADYHVTDMRAEMAGMLSHPENVARANAAVHARMCPN